MLQNERMSVNTLKMYSLGELVIIRKNYLGSEVVRIIDYEIFSRIPKYQITRLKERRKSLTPKVKVLRRKRRRG